MGATMGAVIYPILGKIEAGPEFVVVMLGSISFTAGMASYLRLSPVVVCFIAGAILVNLPGGPKEQVRETLEHLGAAHLPVVSDRGGIVMAGRQMAGLGPDGACL